MHFTTFPFALFLFSLLIFHFKRFARVLQKSRSERTGGEREETRSHLVGPCRKMFIHKLDFWQGICWTGWTIPAIVYVWFRKSHKIDNCKRTNGVYWHGFHCSQNWISMKWKNYYYFLITTRLVHNRANCRVNRTLITKLRVCFTSGDALQRCVARDVAAFCGFSPLARQSLLLSVQVTFQLQQITAFAIHHLTYF